MAEVRRRKGVSFASDVAATGYEKDGEGQDQNDCDGKNRESHEGHNDDLEPGSYWLTRIVFLRFLAFIYLVAFAVSFNQNKELIGENGLLPARLFVTRVKEHVKGGWWGKLEAVPSLIWVLDTWDRWGAVDELLDWIAVTGMILSSLVLLSGCANMPVLAILWVLYHSLVSVGQQWFSFGWESQLLETGFLAIWCVPLIQWSPLPSRLPSPWVAVWGYRWLIFRIMLGAGLIKIRGDKCWRELTCMDYFYQTQPVPNPFTWYIHHAPKVWHSFETFGNHVVELVFPFCTFIPYRPAWIFNGIWQIAFQFILISTGNLSFLNWLTIAPSIWYFDDKFLARFFPATTRYQVKMLQEEDKKMKKAGKSRTSSTRRLVTLAIGALIAYFSVPIVVNLVSSNQSMNRSYDPLRLVNTYGAFGSVTKTRTEVVLQGTTSPDPTSPGAVWREYEFHCKPGDVTRSPCLISPYHYRLDWLMWFAAFQNFKQNPWLLHLIGKLLENDSGAESLIAHNPFHGENPPKFIRAQHFKYAFTKPASKAAMEGKWWNRKVIGEYIPALDLESLKGIYKQFGWKMKKKTKK